MFRPGTSLPSRFRGRSLDRDFARGRDERARALNTLLSLVSAGKRLALLEKERLLEWNAQSCNFSEQIYGCIRQPGRKNNGTEV